MNQMKRIILLSLIMTLTAFVSFAQTTFTGKVLDADTDEPLIGATVAVSGTSTGTATALDGSFNLKVKAGSMKLKISYVGYEDTEIEVSVSEGETKDLGVFALKSNSLNLNEVKVVASVAVHRQTPVALSTLEPKVIIEKIGSQEFPEVLKSTPGVYATKQGGGFGDSRINLRGFDSRNIAVMINGVPINGMENGKVFWSNWAGLSDVTRSMQVQRGLGASRVAVPSVGGTINILTNTTDSKQGGNVRYGIGHNGYQKMGFTGSTGLSENGWASTFMFTKTTGDGWVDNTGFEAYSYFANISKRINDHHTLSLTVFGAPQKHDQRYSKMTIAEFEAKNQGGKFNEDWGYKNGERYAISKNFYHKPQAILNHFWTIDRSTSLSTAFYASIGTGGGIMSDGISRSSEYQTDDGQLNLDKVVDENIANGLDGSSAFMKTSFNNHHWYGVLSTFTKELGNLSLMGGVDGRYYLGEHYTEVDDLLGGRYVMDDSDINDPNKLAKVGDKISFYNDGEIYWGGLFAQAEYKLDALSAFVSISGSEKWYRRIDYYNYLDSDPNQTTDWQDYFGYMVKGGANYNINDNHNVFVNGGYFERQPDFNKVFMNHKNIINEGAKNERVYSAELGYGFRNRFLSANVNAYYTTWLDKSMVKTQYQDNAEGVREYFFANILGVDARHMGVELDFELHPIENLRITGMASVGDWIWLNDLKDVKLFNEDQELIDTYDLYVKDVHVGDAAQQTFALGANYELLKGLRIGADYNYYSKLYAYFDVKYRTEQLENEGNPDSWEMPEYGLVDLNLSYRFSVGGLDATLFGNVNNLFDTEYIPDAKDGANHDWKSAQVYYGWGRTWTMSLRVNF